MGLIGTPFSVLFNAKGEQVYSSHESDDALDGLLKRLASGQQLPTHPSTLMSAQAQQQQLAPLQKGEHYVFITATWCDWYLKESRPQMASQCQTAQQQLNRLAASLPEGRWLGVVNNLWTDEKALSEFNTLYNMQIPFSIDQSGIIFQHFNVRQIPLLLKLSNGKVIRQITDFSDMDQVKLQLQ